MEKHNKHSLKLKYTLQNPKYPNNKILPTTSYKFLEYHMIPKNSQQFSFVYRPGDDSFFMMSVLYQEIQQYTNQDTKQQQQKQSQDKFKFFIRQTFNKKGLSICQIGSGSGILSVHLNQWFKDKKLQPDFHCSTDINPDACLMSQRYYDHYNLRIEAVHTSLFNNLNTPKKIQNQQLNKRFLFKPQIIICNPPYIPTQQQQTISQQKYLKNRIQKTQFQQNDYKFENNMISYSWMGGCDGLQITRKLIYSIKWSCILYIIVMIDEWVQSLQQQLKKQQEQRIKINNNKSNNEYGQNIKRKFEVMQYNKKYNQDLYVIRITILID